MFEKDQMTVLQHAKIVLVCKIPGARLKHLKHTSQLSESHRTKTDFVLFCPDVIHNILIRFEMYTKLADPHGFAGEIKLK